MNQKELKELIEFVIEKDIAEFELERGDVKVKIKRASENTAPTHEVRYMAAPQAAPPSATPAAAAAPAAPAKEAASDEELYTAKSPIVGTFYESPSPGAPPFFKIGDVVEAGQILCIIEAMKLMNEIEAEVSGEIVKRFANNGQPVEYGQPLFAIRPRK
ncbi:MAG TPA: acetyl-CoA carboxylase biotin carboxyl carrier protein [Terriglobales bacterium]|nr:acetyl-CoA carboxylase biotin carboxyl carrier protein [Terriglobales bacterium]